MAEFLFEIGMEEAPARMIAGAEAELRTRVLALLERERLIAAEPAAKGLAKSFSTPRRLAVWVGEVALQQPEIREELTGPSVKVAMPGGQPGPAAIAFARKAGVAVDELRTVSTAKGEYLAATLRRPGRTAAEVIEQELAGELAAIYWAKNMYWRAGKPERFVRPVRWMVALLDETVVPVRFGGQTAANVTRGHRILSGDAAIVVERPAAYREALLEAKVIADVESRRQTVRKALDAACRTLPGTRWREDHALVDKLTHLTEWPTAIAGSFEREFLALPQEVLVTVMRDHQSYFAVEDAEGGLAAHFLAVLNTAADARGEAVIRHGNERVLRARFNDARFFWNFDQRVPLEQRRELLGNVTFQKDLGSYAAKSERVYAAVERLALLLAERGVSLDGAALGEAARLAKTDLTTELVKEFTELQGEIGGLYARAQGCSQKTADAIYDQYLPKSMEDRVPRSIEGAVLAVADKADTIAGMFGLGLEPTGSKDPFALRRAANGVVKILAEATPALPLTLGDATAAAAAGEEVRVRVETFLAERLEFYLREAKALPYDVVKAVLAAGANDVRDAVARGEAVASVRASADFAAIAAAFKRMKNILAQAEQKGMGVAGREAGQTGSVQSHALQAHPAQAELEAAARSTGAEFTRLAGGREYRAALELLATLRAPVDAFFDQVMVMDPDAEVRGERLALLGRLLATFSRIADFSEIVNPG